MSVTLPAVESHPLEKRRKRELRLGAAFVLMVATAAYLLTLPLWLENAHRFDLPEDIDARIALVIAVPLAATLLAMYVGAGGMSSATGTLLWILLMLLLLAATAVAFYQLWIRAAPGQRPMLTWLLGLVDSPGA